MSKANAQSTPEKRPGAFKDIMNPSESLVEEEENTQHTLHAALSRLLGVPLANWPYSEESLKAMVQLKVEQDRLEAENARTRALQTAINLTNRAYSIGVPPHMIPMLFVPADEAFVKNQIAVWRKEQDQQLRQQQQQQQQQQQPIRQSYMPLAPPIYEYGTPSRRQPQQPQPQPGLPPPQPQFQPRMSPTNIPQISPQQQHITQQQQQQQPPPPPPPGSSQQGSPIRHPIPALRPSAALGSHQRSHTIAGPFGTSTTVWKVKLPQQQQFQFHHYNPSQARGSHSRSGSEFTLSKDPELDPDTSNVSVSASPSTSVKHRLQQGHSSVPSISERAHKRTRSDLSKPQALGSPYTFRGQPPQQQQQAPQHQQQQPPQGPSNPSSYYYSPPPSFRQQQGYRFPAPAADQRPSIEERSTTPSGASAPQHSPAKK